MRDPNEITLETSAGVVVPPGPSAGEVLVGEGRIQTTETNAADYAVYARRETDGGLMLRWDTQLPLRDGELQRLVPDPTVFTAPGAAFAGVPPGDALRIQGCSRMGRSYGMHGVFNGYTTSAGDASCSSTSGQLGYTLTTPWSNVTEIHQRTTPTAKLAAWGLLPTALALIGGGLALAIPAHASTERRVGGAALAALGLVIEVPLSPSLFARKHDVKVRVPGS